MLLSLKNLEDLKEKFISYKSIYDNYHVGLFVAQKFTRCWTAINVGVHYADAIDIYNRTFKKTVCFEPDKVFKKLQKHIQDRKLDNVTIHNIPLSDSARHRTFYSLSDQDRSRTNINPNYYIGGSSLNFNWSESQNTDEVKFTEKQVYTQRLDHIVSTTRIKNIDLIKIDAELEDSRIVYGAENCINRWRPVIQIEYCDKKCERTLHNWKYEELEFDVDLTTKEIGKPDRWFVPKERI